MDGLSLSSSSAFWVVPPTFLPVLKIRFWAVHENMLLGKERTGTERSATCVRLTQLEAEKASIVPPESVFVWEV